MRINLVGDLALPRDVHVVDTAHGQEGDGLGNVLFVLVPASLHHRDLSTALHDIDSGLRRAADLVVLRMHPSGARDLFADEGVMRQIVMRLENRPTVVLRFEDGHHRLAPISDASAIVCGEALIKALRHAEFDGLLRKPGVVLPELPEFHYEGPNGKHYASFIRVGTAIQGVDTVDGIDFWLLPFLSSTPVVLLDSWTIISVGLNLPRYVGLTETSGYDVSAIECQSAYSEYRGGLVRRMSGLGLRLASAAGDGADAGAPRDLVPAVVVVSVASTGNLGRELARICTEAGFSPVTVIGLYGSTPDVADEVFCTYAGIDKYYDALACPWCPPDTAIHSPRVRIEPTTYLLELSAAVQTTRVTEASARPGKNFFGLYSGSGCFSIHRDQHDRTRHHMIHVDAERLSAHPVFKKRLADVVRRMPVPDVVLAPCHSAATDLARQVATLVCHEDPIICDPDGLSELPEPERTRLRSAQRILVVDDVIVTGSRLHGYRQHLRDGGFLSSEFPYKLHVLVGVARVPTTATLSSIRDMVHGQDQYWEVENLVLPDWREDRCPWCWEADILERNRDLIARDPVLAKRLDTLRRTTHGIKDGLFLPWQTTDANRQYELGPGSIFVAEGHVEVFVSVASAVQNLRAGGKLDERFTVPMARVLEPEFVHNRYYDPIIYASIMRCAQRHDLRGASSTEPQLAAMVRRQLEKENVGDRGLRAELLLAMARGIVPMQPDVLAAAGLLEEVDGTVEVRKLLRAALVSCER